MTSFIFLFFGVLLVAGVFSMAKIQRQQLLEARAKKAQGYAAERARLARLEAYRAKCFRPDGD